MTTRPDRFREDPRIGIRSLAAHNIYVVCPRCSGRAVDAPRPTDSPYVQTWPRRLACAGCGYSAAWQPPGCSVWGAPVDPFFEVPLWLQRDVRGNTLWAFNEAHLEELEGYVAARLREHSGGLTMLARLPAWLKSARNRDVVLRTIQRLRESLAA